MSAVQIDLRSPVPPFEQIRAQIAGQIAAGALHDGDRLPTVRDLASDLGVAVGTVQRAYRELEAAGQVLSRRRHGTTVLASSAAASSSDARPGRTATLTAAQELVRAARREGLSDGDLLDLVRGALDADR